MLDFYHAAEHLQQFVQAAFTEPTVVHAWFKQARKDLLGGRVDDLIARMQTLVENSSGERQKTLAGQLAYFTTGQKHQRLNYSQVRARKLPIGSGAIESLIRQVVNLRLKGTGKFWLLNHAEIVLHARCQWAAGKWAWANFCDSILTAMLYPA